MATKTFLRDALAVLTGIGMLAAVYLPTQPLRADEGADSPKKIVATTEHGWLHVGTIRNPKEQLLINAYLSERDTNKVVFHTQTAEANYKLQIWLSSGIKYEKLTYEKATIAVTGDVTTVRHEANPEECCTNEQSGPGRTFLSVSATTQEDQRTPPREVRPYTITLHLTGLKAISRAGTTVELGDYDIVYPLQFIFFHNLGSFPGNSVVRLKRCGDALRCVGPSSRERHFHHPKSSGADQVEGPTPILESEDVPTFIIPPGEDFFEIPPFEFPYHFPADFFGPGSEALEGSLKLGGANEDTDTTVRRLEPIELTGALPRTATIPIEMVALNLVSVEPITVSFGDGSQQQWNVTLTLSDGLPSAGEMTIAQTFDGGGTFNSFFDIWTEVTFQSTSGEIVLPVDPITNPITSPIGIIVPIDGKTGPGFVDGAPGTNIRVNIDAPSWTVCPGTTSDFCPGKVSLEFESEISSAIEEIENEINEKLPLWAQRHGGTDQAFNWADQDGDGKLDEEEITRILKDAAVEIPWYIRWSTVSKHLIETYDTDGDGKLNLAELNEALK